MMMMTTGDASKYVPSLIDNHHGNDLSHNNDQNFTL